MSVENVLSTNNQLITNYDTTKIFVWNNEYETGTFVAGAYDDVVPGTVVGRIAASAKLVPLDSSASDGSQFPVGILVDQVAAGDERTATICIAGDVNEGSIVFYNGTDTLSTVVSSRILRDRIAADTKGIRIVPTTELSEFDNQ